MGRYGDHSRGQAQVGICRYGHTYTKSHASPSSAPPCIRTGSYSSASLRSFLQAVSCGADTVSGGRTVENFCSRRVTTPFRTSFPGIKCNRRSSRTTREGFALNARLEKRSRETLPAKRKEGYIASALVAQWIERWRSKPTVGGSSPSEGARLDRQASVMNTLGTSTGLFNLQGGSHGRPES